MNDWEAFDEENINRVKRSITEIADIYQDHSFFWKNAAGWAPDKAYRLLSNHVGLASFSFGGFKCMD